MADSPHFVKYAQPVIRVRVFAGLRERAGWSEKELEGVERVADVWPALGLGEEPPGLLYAVNREYAEPRPRARRRRRGRADPARLRRCVSAERGAALTRRSGRARSPTSARARSPRSSARPASTRAAARCSYLEYEAYPGMAEEVMERVAQELESKYELCDGRDPPPRRPGRDRRDERRDRRLRAAPRRTRSPPARRRSTRSRRPCRCGRRRSTRAARSGSAAAPDYSAAGRCRRTRSRVPATVSGPYSP